MQVKTWFGVHGHTAKKKKRTDYWREERIIEDMWYSTIECIIRLVLQIQGTYVDYLCQ